MSECILIRILLINYDLLRERFSLKAAACLKSVRIIGYFRNRHEFHCLTIDMVLYFNGNITTKYLEFKIV